MPAIAIGSQTAARRPGQAHPKAALIDETGRRFVFPFMPREVDYAGGYPTWAQMPRPKLKPILKRAGTNLRTIALEALIARLDHQDSVEDLLADLGAIVKAGQRVTFTGGPATAGVWRIDGDSFTTRTTGLRQGDNAITRATVAMTLIEASDRGPIVPPPTKRPRTYRVKRGDTLGSIAQRFYGSRLKWRIIADAQHPKLRRASDLKVGAVLRLPAK